MVGLALPPMKLAAGGPPRQPKHKLRTEGEMHQREDAEGWKPECRGSNAGRRSTGGPRFVSGLLARRAGGLYPSIRFNG